LQQPGGVVDEAAADPVSAHSVSQGGDGEDGVDLALVVEGAECGVADVGVVGDGGGLEVV
jgi:hypothetical protein